MSHPHPSFSLHVRIAAICFGPDMPAVQECLAASQDNRQNRTDILNLLFKVVSGTNSAVKVARLISKRVRNWYQRVRFSAWLGAFCLYIASATACPGAVSHPQHACVLAVPWVCCKAVSMEYAEWDIQISSWANEQMLTSRCFFIYLERQQLRPPSFIGCVEWIKWVYFGDWEGIKFKLDISGADRPMDGCLSCFPMWLSSHTHLLLEFGASILFLSSELICLWAGFSVHRLDGRMILWDTFKVRGVYRTH